MIVLDASAVIELLLGTPAGRIVATRIANNEESLHAPHLLTVEVVQVLRRLNATGIISNARSAAALTDFLDLDIERWDHEVLARRIWALRHNLTAYDGAYIALAESLPAPLLTADRRLAGAPGNTATVDVI